MSETSARPASSMHEDVFATPLREIESELWKEGERLPSEAGLTARFGHSRITVGREVRDLQACLRCG